MALVRERRSLHICYCSSCNGNKQVSRTTKFRHQRKNNNNNNNNNINNDDNNNINYNNSYSSPPLQSDEPLLVPINDYFVLENDNGNNDDIDNNNNDIDNNNNDDLIPPDNNIGDSELILDSPERNRRGRPCLPDIDFSSSLFENSPVTVGDVVDTLINFSIKQKHSKTSTDQLFGIIKKILPTEDQEKFPTFYQAKKQLFVKENLIQKIDACPKDCILFIGDEYSNLTHCPVCNESRYENDSESQIKKPRKVFNIYIYIYTTLSIYMNYY